MTDFKAQATEWMRSFDIMGGPVAIAALTRLLSSAEARGVERAIERLVDCRAGSEALRAAAQADCDDESTSMHGHDIFNTNANITAVRSLLPSPATPPAEPELKPCDLAKALRLILPLAKGYAHQHQVGSNADYIAFAEETLLAWNTRAPVKAGPEFASPEPHHIQWANAGTAYLKDGPTIPEPVRKDAEPGAAHLDLELEATEFAQAAGSRINYPTWAAFVLAFAQRIHLSSRREAFEEAANELENGDHDTETRSYFRFAATVIRALAKEGEK